MTAPGGTLVIDVEVDGKKARRQLSSELQAAGADAGGAGKAGGHVFGLGFAAAAGVAIGRGLKTAAALEQTEVGLRTLTGSAEGAQQMLGELTQFARSTPFEMQGLAENARSLLGVGRSADEVLPIMQSVGDASAALGLSQAQLDQVMRAVTQSFAKGKVQQEEMLQMAEAGLPVYDLFARAVGKSVPEMQEMATNGELLADDVLPALFDVMNEDFAGGMLAQSKTLNGALSTVKDDISLGLAEAVKDLLPLLTEFLPEASAGAGGAINVLGVAVTSLSYLLAPVVELVGAISEGFGALPTPIQTSVVAMLLLGRIMGAGGLIGNLLSLGQNLFAARSQMAAGVRNASSFTGALSSLGRTAAGAAGRTGMGALASSLVGGKWGAAALGLGLVVTAAMEIGKQSAKARKSVDTLLDTVDVSDDASVDSGFRRMRDELESLEAEYAKNHGIPGFRDLFTELDNEIDATRDGMEELRKSQERYDANLVDVASQLGMTTVELEALARASEVDLNLLASDDAGDVATFVSQLKEANGAVKAGFDPTSALGQAMAVFADEAADAADRSGALRDALDALSGKHLGVAEASANWAESMRDLTDAFHTTNKDGKEILDDLALAAVDAGGKLDVTTEAGGRLHDAFMGARDSMLDSAQAAYDNALATGQAGKANELVGAEVQKARDEFIKQAEAVGLTNQQAVALADSYGLIPGEVATAIATPGMDQALLDLITVHQRITGLPPNTPVKVDALTADAEAELVAMGLTVKRLPDGSVEVTAKTDQAKKDLDAFVSQPRTVQVAVRAALNSTSNMLAAFGFGGGKATGGLINGPGTGTSDTAGLYALSHGEYVVKAARVAQLGVPFMDWLNGGAGDLQAALMRARGQLAQGFASGGLITRPDAPATVAGDVTNVTTYLTAAPTIPTEQQLAQVWRRGQLLAAGGRRRA